jgi:hypothetical protein
VANAYEMLGLVEEKERIIEKYSHLFIKEGPILTRKGGRMLSARKKKMQPSESRKDSEEK